MRASGIPPIVAAFCVALAAAGCATADLSGFYRLEAGAAPIPVMVSAVKGSISGARPLELLASDWAGSTMMQTEKTYQVGSAWYTEKTTTSYLFTETTNQPLKEQLAKALRPGDRFVSLEKIEFYRYGFMMPYWGEFKSYVKASGAVAGKGGKP